MEELAHVRYLLGEIDSWTDLGANVRVSVRARYQRRQRELEVQLGLRLPPLTAQEAQEANREVLYLSQELQLLEMWGERGWMSLEWTAKMRNLHRERIQDLRARLLEPGTPWVSTTVPPADRIAFLRELRQEVDTLQEAGVWVDEAAYADAAANLEERIEQTEIRYGMRRRPTKKKTPAKPSAPALASAKPREPLTWDRVWHTLLSERTLRALLFVGVFLVSASAFTLVVFNWESFAPWVQVLILTAFTLSFYGLGWFVRVRMGLQNAGVGLAAAGSLLVPIDFYAIYLSGGVFRPGSWPTVWLIASSVCLVAYAVTMAVLRAEFFGYLVGVAGSSFLCASLQVAGVSGDWWTAALSVLALLLLLPARWLECGPEDSPRQVLGRPFRHLALLTVTCVLLLTTGFRVANRIASLVGSEEVFRVVQALDWWLAGVVFAIAAARRPRRTLVSATSVTIPVALYLTLSLWLEGAGVSMAWHAFGWALLTPFYLLAAHLLQHRSDQEPRRRQGHTLAGWAVALLLLAAVWGLGHMTAAAATYTVLTGSLLLAVVWWQRPTLVPAVSTFSCFAVTAAMAARGLDVAQYSLGWVSLSILHVISAIRLRPARAYMPFVYGGGVALAGLALLPPLVTLDRGRMAYALFNWIALCGWLAQLAHDQEERPGLGQLLDLAGPFRRTAPHWGAALPLPIWFWLVWVGVRDADGWLGVGLAALAWGCLGLGHRLSRHDQAYRLPWHVMGFVNGMAGLLVALVYGDQLALAITLLSSAAYFFCYTYLVRDRYGLVWGGLILPVGYLLLLDDLGLPRYPLAASLALVPIAYILVRVWLERARGVGREFLQPFHTTIQVVSAAAFLWGFAPLWDAVLVGGPWADSARLWTAGSQLLLGVAYGLGAWYLSHEPWGHVAAWLGITAGGLVASAYSHGRGFSAVEAALIAVIYVLAERGLHARRELRAWIEKAWSLYRRPLLVAGWCVSAGSVVLALGRNLVLLGGGPARETWSIISLSVTIALYAASARLYRRPLFLWLAAPLQVILWTLLTHRGWYIWETPPAPRYGLAWVVLAWVLLPVGLALDKRARRRYGHPLRLTAHLLLPFALLWGSGDRLVSSVSCGLGIAFYLLAAAADHRRGQTGLVAARFLYPAALLVPVWAVYVLAWRMGWLPQAHFGLLLTGLSPLLLVAARRLRRVDPADATPAYLAAWGCALVGTMLVSYDQPLLALVLLYDAGLALISVRLLRDPLWIYPAAALPPVALLLALGRTGLDPHRHGWWLIGLGAVYLVQAWALRRAGGSRYATPLMAAAYAVISLGLPVSSREQVAAAGAYGAAAILYAISAFWLREPLLLTPAVLLAAVPYAIGIDRAAWLPRAYHGLAWWPGVIVALAGAHVLDRVRGAPRDFPWGQPARWLTEAARRMAGWWALPLYVWGYVVALVAVILSGDHPAQLAAAWLLAGGAYGLAAVRFRLRGWLLAAVVSVQAAALAAISAASSGVWDLPETWVDLLRDPAWRGLVFLPVNAITAALGLWIARQRGEGSPLENLGALWRGWSRPLFWLLGLDVMLVQIVALAEPCPGTWVSLAHALLIAVLAAAWVDTALPYWVVGLGVLAVLERHAWVSDDLRDVPVWLALLALGYGLMGYGLEYLRRREDCPLPDNLVVFERPMERGGLGISVATLLATGLLGPRLSLWLVRSALGRQMLAASDVPAVQMVSVVLALSGLLYLATALVRRKLRLGYAAVLMLLVSWSLEWFLVRDMREVQWYAVPAGLYLLVVGLLEWRQDRRRLARWIDRAAVLLLLGSSFYQSLAEPRGWPYALLMGGESLFLLWWGSARRQRRFLYYGVVGVVVAVCGQLIRQLVSVEHAWIAFGVPGLIIMAVIILIERRLEATRQLSQDLAKKLEEWD